MVLRSRSGYCCLTTPDIVQQHALFRGGAEKRIPSPTSSETQCRCNLLAPAETCLGVQCRTAKAGRRTGEPYEHGLSSGQKAQRQQNSGGQGPEDRQESILSLIRRIPYLITNGMSPNSQVGRSSVDNVDPLCPHMDQHGLWCRAIAPTEKLR